MLSGKKIVLGVTGGIAVYKACELARLFIKRGAQLRVVMTDNAARFVPPLTFETLSGNRVYTDTFAHGEEIEHISLAKWADLFVVAPATANFMAKAACGIADDLLSTTQLALTCPVLIAPAMNTAMWRHPATQANLETLKARGVRFIGPARGALACGDSDEGRMCSPEEIADAAEAILCPVRDFEGRRVLVTAGPTVERIDPVRYITNRSSGKMGYALAEAAAARGADVTLISGPVALGTPEGVRRVDISSCAELCAAVLENGAASDIVIQAAAPADFTVRNVAAQKIKKTGEGMTLELVSTTDIAAELGRRKHPGQILVAFAAETNDLLENARKKLEKKNADLIVANDVSRSDAGFGVDTNAVTLMTRAESRSLPLMSKRATADAILDAVREMLPL